MEQVNMKLKNLTHGDHHDEPDAIDDDEEDDENTVTIEQVPITVTCAQLAHNLGELNIDGIREFDFYLLGSKLTLNESIISQCKLVKGAAKQTKLINIKLLIEQDKRRIEIIDILKLKESNAKSTSSGKTNNNHDRAQKASQAHQLRSQGPSMDLKSIPKSCNSNTVSQKDPSIRHKLTLDDGKVSDKCNALHDFRPNIRHTGSDSLKLMPKSEIDPDIAFGKKNDINIYDSVTIVQIQRNNNELETQDIKTSPKKAANTNDEIRLNPPPPLPMHQSDRWELELYNLADETFSTLIKPPKSAPRRLDHTDSHIDTDEQASSRKSSSSLRNEIISLVKPSFTTIDGDLVVEDLVADHSLNDSSIGDVDSINDTSHRAVANTLVRSSGQMDRIRLGSLNLGDNFIKPSTPNLFDSPLRSRGGKDNILRTQSVRRNPTPEKLYDFILADLVKRGYLVKPGAIKNHNRWFVLKNFHLYSYKCESDEKTKTTPNLSLKLDPDCHIVVSNQSGETSFPFKVVSSVKTLSLIASSSQSRDDWIRTLTVTINMSDIEPETLRKDCSIHDGLVSVTRQGNTKRCYATLINHVLFFLKSLADPTPLSYISMRKAKIREVTDNLNYDSEEQDIIKRSSQDCSLAIYPKYSMALDPVYMTLVGQQETDKWLYYLSMVTGLDQSYGTPYERTLTKLMVNNSIINRRYCQDGALGPDAGPYCFWKEQSIMLYTDKPILQPLTSLPNETLKVEAIELFKSILLFTQVPIEPIAIDYHVSLLQNCLGRFLRYPELRNEFYAQLIKQCTLVVHSCGSSKISSNGSSCSPTNQRFSFNSLSQSSSECQFITDFNQLDSLSSERSQNIGTIHSSRQDAKKRNDSLDENTVSPTQSELLQVVQILAISVSLDLPRGRIRWWLSDFLRKLANPEINIGKYALYTLNAIDRAVANGTRINVPSRTEIMSILLRNPYDHSNPHSLPVNFCDGSYLVVEADGSTTVEEFLSSMSRSINIRHSSASDFYLFADDPSGTKEVHILELQRKVLDIVGWWEQTFRKNNSGRYQSTKFIKLTCRKRLVLRSESDETDKERALIVHQLNQEVVSQKLPLNDTLVTELGAIMAQLSHGDFKKVRQTHISEEKLDKIVASFHPNKSSQGYLAGNPKNKFLENWTLLSGKPAQDCVRIYLNCIRRLRLDE